MSRAYWVIPFAYGLGFIAAIPIGASQVEVIKRALARRYSSALLSAAGTVTSDMFYGFLALFGLSRFLEKTSFLIGFQWVAAVLLAVLSYLTWWQSKRVLVPDEEKGWAGGGISYLTGLTVGISYPPIMLTWLMGAAIAKGMKLTENFPPHLAACFVLAGGAGLFSYMAVLTLILRKTHHFYSDKTIRRIYQGLSILLGLISLGFLCSGAFRILDLSKIPS